MIRSPHRFSRLIFVSLLLLVSSIAGPPLEHFGPQDVSADTIDGISADPFTGTQSLSPSLAPYVGQIARLKSILSPRYEVQFGIVHYFTIDECKKLTSCFGNNPGSPYGLYYFHLDPGETVGQGAARLPGTARWYSNWHLGPQDAILYIGVTPENLTYFSFRSYLFTRDYSTGPTTLFASLGDSLNNLTINTVGGAAGTSPYGQLTSVITTADKSTNADVVRAMKFVGFPAQMVNTDIVPSKLPLNMGYEASDDDFVMLNRVAGFASPEAMNAYISHPPAIVIRLKLRTATPPNPYPTLGYSNRKTGTTEDQTIPGLATALSTLKAAVIQQYPGATMSNQTTVPIKGLVGLSCIQVRANCNGDNWDTTYTTFSGADQALRDDPNDFYYVLGVNHYLTRFATYSSITVFNNQSHLGVLSVLNNAFPGSGSVFLPQNPLSPYLYAYKIARHCNGQPYCVEVPTQFPGVALDETLSVVERAYLNPQTKVGPDYSEIIMPILLHFVPKTTSTAMGGG